MSSFFGVSYYSGDEKPITHRFSGTWARDCTIVLYLSSPLGQHTWHPGAFGLSVPVAICSHSLTLSYVQARDHKLLDSVPWGVGAGGVLNSLPNNRVQAECEPVSPTAWAALRSGDRFAAGCKSVFRKSTLQHIYLLGRVRSSLFSVGRRLS